MQVLAARNIGKQTSEWYKDTIDLVKENRVHFFDSGYPAIIQTVPNTLLRKLKYHIILQFLKLKIKGNYYDRSAMCKGQLLAEVEKYVGMGYADIIISVGPFMYAKYLLSIKERFPDVRLYLDVRDPWTNNKTAFGYWNLSPERFRFEKNAEKEVVENYDRIYTVADGIGEFFVKEYKVKREKVTTLHNGFDPSDFDDINEGQQARNILIFTGNLYEKAEKSFLMLIDQLKRLKSENSDFFERYECHFYGEIHPSFAHYFSGDINLLYKGKIPLHEVFDKIVQSRACLLFLTDDLNFSFSTKFFEYLSQKKPIIVFSDPGNTGKFVEEHNIGRQANSSNLLSIIDDIENNRFYNKGYDISEFELGHLTERLLNDLGIQNRVPEKSNSDTLHIRDKEKEKVLFIAYQFPPIGGPGVQRSVQFVRYLRENNYEPVVMTINESSIEAAGVKTDSSLFNLIPGNTRIIRTPAYQPLGLIRFLNKLKIFRFFWFFLYPLFWERSALWPFLVYKKVSKIVKTEKTGLVYTSSGPFSSLILGYLLKRRLKVKWVADLRDPFTDGYQWSFPSKIHWYFMRMMEKWILSKPDHLIVNTEELKKLYLKRKIIQDTRISVIMNGY